MKKNKYIPLIIAVVLTVSGTYVFNSLSSDDTAADTFMNNEQSISLSDNKIGSEGKDSGIEEQQIEGQINKQEQNTDSEKKANEVQPDSNTVINNKSIEKTGEVPQDVNNTEKNLLEESTEDTDIYNDKHLKFMRSDGQNDVITDVIFMNPIESKDIEKDHIIFKILLSTHSYDINERELNKKLTVKINDLVIDNVDIIKWLPDGMTEGHHVSGNILIPKLLDGKDLSKTEIRNIEILMNDVAGAKQRTFKWTEQELK